MNQSKIHAGLALLGALGVLASAGQAAAHAHLVSSNPPAGGAASPTRVVIMRFSEALEPKFSAATLSDAAGKPVAADSTATGKQLMLTAHLPFAPGAYKLNWRVVSLDGHRTQGDFGFTIR